MVKVQTLSGAEKSLLRRLINSGNDAETAVKMVAMWRWLASQGFRELISMINSRNDEFLASISEEALEFISKRKSDVSISPDLTLPLTASLAGGSPAALINILSRKDDFSDGVRRFCSELRNKVAEIPRDAINEGRRSEREITVTELNPNAREWNPIENSAPEEERCLFLTFSNGYPLSEHQIINFFTRKFGTCVERVYVHYREGKKAPPLFGKVVFTASSVPAMVLGGKRDVKLCVEKKTLWCKRYDSRKTRFPAPPAAASQSRWAQRD